MDAAPVSVGSAAKDVRGKAQGRLDRLRAAVPALGIATERKTLLFGSLDSHRQLTDRGIDANDVLRIVKRRARTAGLNQQICRHTFRATGITASWRAGGMLERAAATAAHESTRTTQLCTALRPWRTRAWRRPSPSR